ncbi:MAG: hypothetical protein R3A51_21980 [Nannocystaceae bacterium]
MGRSGSIGPGSGPLWIGRAGTADALAVVGRTRSITAFADGPDQLGPVQDQDRGLAAHGPVDA